LEVPHRFCLTLDFIFCMTKYTIKSGDFLSAPFYTNIGVPQGDPISPVLFSLFITDLPSSLQHTGVFLHNVCIPYIQYADDLCILGDSPADLQLALDNLQEYCAVNKIDINVSKTKVQVFHRGRLPATHFTLNGQDVEMVNDFVYLGFNFSVQLSFSQHVKNITAKARSKCGLLFAQLPLQHLPLATVIDLFDVFILPSFTYGLPLWINNSSTSSMQGVDATLTKYLKRYLQVPTHSNNATVHFLTSTIPLSKRLQSSAPNHIHNLCFPNALNGHKLTFISTQHIPANAYQAATTENLERIPTTFWLSRSYKALPSNQRARRSLCRELLDSDHLSICSTTTFHTSPSQSCRCTVCGSHAHTYHIRDCLT
jgi:hypothetical protein